MDISILKLVIPDIFIFVQAILDMRFYQATEEILIPTMPVLPLNPLSAKFIKRSF